uniref:RUN domain-containing protein n=1 Tax=Heterorhabditis bacteriophora TaxID=37862 RepID=A0A1I7XFA2_HETBA
MDILAEEAYATLYMLVDKLLGDMRKANVLGSSQLRASELLKEVRVNLNFSLKGFSFFMFLSMSTFHNSGFRVTSLFWQVLANCSDAVEYQHIGGEIKKARLESCTDVQKEETDQVSSTGWTEF